MPHCQYKIIKPPPFETPAMQEYVFNYPYTSAVELAKAIADQEVSPVEVMRQCLERQAALEPVLNCFVTPMPEQAMAAARLAEQAVMAGEHLGALHGVPISVKDLIAVGGVPQTFGSRTMASNLAAGDAPSVERVKAAGACIIGKTTTTEFGCKGGGPSPLSGTTRNPWDLSKTPGGSSLGAASSVAAGVTPFALGTDGGGSIRLPSSFSGLFGIKAQFGRVPVFPVAATPTLAHVGPLARTVRDAALLLGVISGHDRRDPFSVAGPVPDYLGACERPVKGMRIAWAPHLGYGKPQVGVLLACEAAVKTLEGLGCEIVDWEDTAGDADRDITSIDPIDLWMAEFYAGVGTRLKATLRDHRELLDPAVARMLEPALHQSLEDYYAKVFRRYELRERMRQRFEGIDLLLTPTTPCTAFGADADAPQDAGDNIISWMYATYPFNLTGQPAASIPVGFSAAGLPIGMQMVAKINGEVDIFRAAAALEAARPWADKRPELPVTGARQA
jgi:Asp-tRNA(Asn)/Glu-tRNA(Gln) amidotransferase A subunit family amidase